MKNRVVAVLVLFALLLSVPSVFAAVEWNPETGTGFVGKGDVQDAFGWNNAQLQQNAAGVSFSKVIDNFFLFECVTSEGEVVLSQPGSYPTTYDVLSEVVTNKNQVTGFNLTGLGGGGGGLVVGCVAGLPRVTPTGTSAPSLYVNYGATSVKLQ